MKNLVTPFAATTRKRRPCELVSIIPTSTKDGLGIAVTVSWKGKGYLTHEVFAHDETPDGLARAIDKVAAWIRNNATDGEG